MICTNCFDYEMIETTTQLECVGTVPCMQCPDCDYVIFMHDQSLVIDKMRRDRDKAVHDLLANKGITG